MSRELGLHSQSWTFRPHFAHGAERAESMAPALLIEVPAVGPSPRPARRPSQAATERARIWGVSEQPRRRRRRLRREVRLAGYAIAAAASLTVAGVLLGGLGVNASAHADAVRPPAVSLSIEPAALSYPDGPVVLPGYLLPADASEESNHAGG